MISYPSTTFTAFLGLSGILQFVIGIAAFIVVYVLVEYGLEKIRTWAFSGQRSSVNNLWETSGTIIALVDGLVVTGTTLSVDGLLKPAFGVTLVFILGLIAYRLRCFVIPRSEIER